MMKNIDFSLLSFPNEDEDEEEEEEEEGEENSLKEKKMSVDLHVSW
jgi:hypothetical protein